MPRHRAVLTYNPTAWTIIGTLHLEEDLTIAPGQTFNFDTGKLYLDSILTINGTLTMSGTMTLTWTSTLQGSGTLNRGSGGWTFPKSRQAQT